MAILLVYLRSLIFFVWFLAYSVALHIAFLPTLPMGWKGAEWSARQWSRAGLWGLKVFAGLRYEVRGREHIPRTGALIAAKHYSMWETMALSALAPDPVFVIKRSLRWVPLFGLYMIAARMIAIDRRAGASAVRKMTAAAKRAIADGRQILIFPEGTRKKPSDAPDYKPGVAGLYAQLGAPCVPVAHNSGLFWTAGGILKKPGTIVVEFLPAIPPGLPRAEFMRTLETRIEAAATRLVAEGQALLAAQGLG